uniref:Reverse transcriptase domain-containing protein n=1 Tax=Oreochromis niloticus TaxID=8128 RepID=I3KYI1_ORENI
MGQSVLRDGRTPFGSAGRCPTSPRPIERESGSNPRTWRCGDRGDLSVSPLSSPRRRLVRGSARRALFPGARPPTGLIFLSYDKSWRRGTGGALPSSVSIGVRIPWCAQPCVLCPKVLVTAREALSHIKRSHNVRQCLVICKVCAMTRPSLGSAVTHANKCGIKRPVAAGRPTPFPCDFCPKAFSTKGGLSLHRRCKHSDEYMEEVKSTTHRTAKRRKVSTSDVPLNTDLSHLEAAPPDIAPVNVMKPALLEALGSLDQDSWPLNPLASSAAMVNKVLKNWIKKLAPAQPRRLPIINRKRPLGRTATKAGGRLRYRSIQKLYARSRKDVAMRVLDDREVVSCTLGADLVTRTYRNIWEKPDSFRGLGQFGVLPPVDNSPLCTPISPAEVLSVVRKIKRSGAAGPDGIKRHSLHKFDEDGRFLACVFNGILVNGVLPACLKKSRTTLIPKSMDPMKLADIGNWRPLTISSVICRAFSGILAKRLTDICELHPRQRGFIASPGCAENLAILNGMIRTSKRKLLPLAVVFIDFAKAFDSVSHKHIAEVLTRMGVDEHLRDLIRDSYRNCSTTIRAGKTATPPIRLNVGVKQGDPLSPLLFNLALDPLLRTLDVEGRGFDVGGQRVTSFAFADDLVLVSDSWAGMDRNLRILEKFSEMTGLEVNPTKCHSFMISISGRRYEINNCSRWLLKGTPINMVGGESSVKYLGVNINPLRGILQPPIREELGRYVARVSAAPLKPTQKLLILSKYAIPRILYIADHGMAGVSLLEGCDRDIRAAAKRWLHLDPCTTDSLLYSACRDGGLGLIRLAALIPIMQARRLVSLFHSEDPGTQSLIKELVAEKEILGVWKRACKMVGLSAESAPSPLPGNLPMVSSLNWRKCEFQKWCGHKMQGVGISSFKGDRVSNHWLSDPCRYRFHESETLLALRLRSGTIQTKAFSAIGRAWLPAECTLCGGHRETIGHLIGNCPTLQPNRMNSHNKVCRYLENLAVSMGWAVQREPHLVGPHGKTGVPDLVMIKGPCALIIDVTICYEVRPDTLSNADALKVRKYTGFEAALMARHPKVKAVAVYGFPMGARGKWFYGNYEVLTKLGIGKTRAREIGKSLSRRVLLQTINLVKAYRRLSRSKV